jgi:hypothetical protein
MLAVAVLAVITVATTANHLVTGSAALRAARSAIAGIIVASSPRERQPGIDP